MTTAFTKWNKKKFQNDNESEAHRMVHISAYHHKTFVDNLSRKRESWMDPTRGSGESRKLVFRWTFFFRFSIYLFEDACVAYTRLLNQTDLRNFFFCISSNKTSFGRQAHISVIERGQKKEQTENGNEELKPELIIEFRALLSVNPIDWAQGVRWFNKKGHTHVHKTNFPNRATIA